ncbi:AbiV family abortive infection protein [Phenylobacterium sp. LjRoot225]|uniref:AbiV family abortive infection protein n=1 Tax=Phenylobacterium sp. LjRoot225 TaxID=3342285 RepID=UPI003ECE3371
MNDGQYREQRDGALTAIGRALDAGQFGLTREQLGILLRNADRLYEDAMYLATGGRLQSARSLAVLSYEEVGKLVLMGWRKAGYDAPSLRMRGEHLQKQLAASTIVMAAWLRDRAEEAVTQRAVPKEVAALVQALRGSYQDSLAIKVLSLAFEGYLDRQKQAGFYLDFDELGVPFHDPASGADVVSVLQQTCEAASALRDPRTLEAGFKIASALPSRRGVAQGRRPSRTD